MSRLMLILISAMLLLSSCSYSEFDQDLQDKLNQQYDGNLGDTTPSTAAPESDGDSAYVTLQTEWEADIDIKYVPIGKEYSDYYDYNDGFGTYGGIKGLVYTIDAVDIFDSVYDSGIPIEEMRKYAVESWADRAKFVVVKIRGKYQNPTDKSENDSITGRFDWNSATRYGADYKYFKTYENDGENANCSDICYFSAAPQKGDVNALTGKEFDPSIDFYVFKNPLVSGEEFSFEIGMFYQQELIDDKNVYLSKFMSKPSDSGDPIVFVDLLGRFSDDKK